MRGSPTTTLWIAVTLALLAPATAAGELAPPDYSTYHGGRAYADGLIAIRAGRLDEALTAARRATALTPDDPDALYLLGVCLIFEGEYEDARDALERVIALRPDLAEAYHDLGLVRFQLDDGDGAMSAFARLAELRPGSWHGPYRQAQTAAMKLGDWETCEAMMRLALDRGFPWLASLPVDPEWGPVAGDPAFLGMVTRLLEGDSGEPTGSSPRP
jgi:tetratricopeptide (TPR) repeat protein